MAKEKRCPLNPGEAKTLKAAIFDLSENAAKQALYGIIQILSLGPQLNRTHLEEIIDDARKLSEMKNKQIT